MFIFVAMNVLGSLLIPFALFSKTKKCRNDLNITIFIIIYLSKTSLLYISPDTSMPLSLIQGIVVCIVLPIWMTTRHVLMTCHKSYEAP